MNFLEGLKRLYIVISALLVVCVAGTVWADSGGSYVSGGFGGFVAAFVLWVVWRILRWVIAGFFPAATRKR